MGWGPLDRLHDVVTGLGGGLQAVPGLAWDLSRAPFVDDDVDGIFGTINATVTSRTGQLFGNIFGPEEGVGALVGGVPGREHLSGPIQGVFEGLETAYREGVAEPVSTFATAMSLSSSPSYQEGRSSLATMFDPDTWQEADHIAETRSPGQAIVLAFGTKDILDEEELERFQATDWYMTSTGTLDALGRLFLSPDVILGKAGMVRRASRPASLGGPLGRITERAAPQIGGRAERLGQLTQGLSGGRIRLGDRITAINNAMDRTYEQLPGPIQAIIGSERDFLPSDITRLERLETTRRELFTQSLEDRVRRSTDPTEIGVLGNVVESRRVREARIQAGQGSGAPEFQGRLAEALSNDIDSYFAAPPRRGVVGQILRTPAWQRVDRLIDTLPTDVDERAGLIRDRLFPTHHRGDILGRFLAEAQGTAEREQVMRVALGDMRSFRQLEESNWALSQRLKDLTIEQSAIRSQPVLRPLTKPLGGQMDLFGDAPYYEAITGQLNLLGDEVPPFFDDYRNTRERLARIGDEIDAIVPENQRFQRLEATFNSLPAGPDVTRGGQLRNAVKGSSFYQTSWAGRKLRLVSDMRPHHLVNSEDPMADSHLGRMLVEAGYDDQAVAQARGQFMALDPATRGAALERWVDRATHRILKDNGLDDDEVAEVLAHAHLGRNQANVLIRGAHYDGNGRARVRFNDGDEIVDIELPLSVTQLQNVVNVPNFNQLRQHAARYARLKYGDNWQAMVTRGAKPAWTASQYGLDAMRGIMEIWRPAVLLRPAWTLRVVGDEQMRMLAKFGALSMMLGRRDAVNNYMTALRDRYPAIKRVLRQDAVTRIARRTGFSAAGTAVAGPLGGIAAGTLGNRLVRRMAAAEEAGFANVRFGGRSLSGPFGDAGSTGEFYRTHNSARGAVDELFGRHENRFFGALRRDPTRYRTYTWGEGAQSDAVYRAEWANNLRNQIAQDEMGRQFLAGKTPDEVLEWMDNTLEGRAYAAKVPWRSDHRGWVDAYADQVDAYTGGVDEVKARILTLGDNASQGDVAQILDLIPESRRAPIHGAETDQMQARNPITQLVGTFVDEAFNVLGTMATDNLSRNPTFARFYQAESRRLFSTLVPGQPVSERLLVKLEDQSRAFALRETRQLLYDLAEQSRFADMTRLVMPFYNAWQEVLTRWTGLAVENPVFALRARQAWEAPDRLGWTYTDDRGSTFLRIRIPEFARPLVNQGVFKGALDSQGYIFLDKKGFNLVAQGTPGFGPFVQIGVSEMVKANPEMEESVRFIIPFGPTDGFVDAMLPPTVRRALDASGNDEGAARANAEARILVTRLTQMQTGEIPMVDMSDPAARAEFLASVDEEADAFMHLRLFTGFVAPVAPLYESPYKPYIDIYRALRDGDYERARQVGAEFGIEAAEAIPRQADTGDRSISADDVFLEAFGEEYFALTQSFTRSVNGVPPTVEGLEASEKYGDLITAFPEWGGVIAGYDGGGTAAQFSRAVYDRQMAKGERRRLTPDEVLDGPDIRLGWARYSKISDLLEAVRVSRGLPNMQVAEAEDLRQIKRVFIASLASRYPAWYDEFSVTDRNAWSKRIEGARAMTENESLMGRPDVEGLAEYLRIRDAITAVLATRESQALDATSNVDVAMMWRSLVANLVERNPEFADLFYRKLENDPLSANPLDVITAA